ncbi:uncharacterized protein MELLADRAFT_85402 [Melampsora larici-populina 98AG31]|uniref:Uncharacterized protein n=1 Tax=Melampsora larici-populina (strain 98AG31 / pathotype 3-4-7) TaxID=747676 RepID=F4RIJ8_MELLP|nr:uncharacterized protein MELLADRAFT_85402 [Melampsora larici-populina 98AG31]EGG07824.1 hypothetical protein MELLADRAFT_85402 [Melampsora larici-populina 98AG31]
MPVNTRSRKKTPPGVINLRGLKRRQQLEAERDQADTRRRRLETQTSNQTQPNNQSSNQPQNQSQQSPSEALELEEITVHNYGDQKKFWTLQQIEEQLKSQTADNNSRPNPLILAEAKALHDAFQHSLHMLAMIGQIHLNTLKSHLGIAGRTRATHPWNRFLAFAKLAYKNPMPLRGAPDAGPVLAMRNQANRKAYDKLNDDEYAIFTSRIFHALGGYPDYSAINVEDHETAGDCEVLIPEVPALSPEEEALYRPIYDKLVDSAKVAKDRERFKADSPEKKERLSLRAFKKRVQQLHHDAALADFDYYAIGCSKTLGTGWCEEFTSLPEISTWMDERIKFQTIFPIYSQARPKIKEIEAAGAAAAAGNNTNTNKFTRPPNKSDRESTELTSLLLAQTKALDITLPTRGFPRGPDLPAVFDKHKINLKFLRHTQSAMSISEFMLGFDGMKTLGRRHWLQDIKDQKFMMVTKDSPVNEPWSVLGGEIQEGDDGNGGNGAAPGGDGGDVGTGGGVGSGGDSNGVGAGGGVGPGDGGDVGTGGGVGSGGDSNGVGTGGGVGPGGDSDGVGTGGGVGPGGDSDGVGTGGGDGEIGDQCVHL